MCIVIKELEEKDCPVIADFEKKYFHDGWSAQQFSKILQNENYIYMTAWKGKAFAGYLGVHCVLDEAEILNIAVDEAWRKHKIGSALMEQMISILQKKNVKNWFLEVRASNEAAICLYQKYEFVHIGVRKDYYSDPKEDAVLMQKQI